MGENKKRRVVEIRGVSRAYRYGNPVLEDVDLDISAGEVVGLLGRNGAGKTTLIRIIMGMIRPQSGSVRVFGLDPLNDAVEIKRRVGYVSEDQVFPARARVSEVIGLHRALYPGWDEAFAVELLERFNLHPRPRMFELSKGQARQVALVCAVAHRPELLVLDEPAGGLDSVARREFLETAVRLLAESGTAILFSSHHMNDVERLAGRVVLLHEHRVQVDTDLDDLKEGYSLAVMPANGLDWDQVAALPGAVRARRRGETLHAVFRHDPEAAREVITSELGGREIQCTQVPLEELFIELVGGTAS